MVESFGDSSRAGDWAAVRISVEGERIVAADAPGLERDLVGLTLLEAAAVGGGTLAVDALANALAPVFRAAPEPQRVAVAMSGGVDSAVALLKAGPQAVGVTLRLWLGPAGAGGGRWGGRRAPPLGPCPGRPGRRAPALLPRRRPRGACPLPRARDPARDAR